MEPFDVIVLGAGAAGLFCAATAGARGRRVLVLEHAARPGSKILISGGGRCNFTNLHAAPIHFRTSGSPHFVKSALARYTPADFVARVERHGIAWHEKKLGQLFCDRSSRDIVAMLEAECAAAGVDLRLECGAMEVRRDPGPPGLHFGVRSRLGHFGARAVVVATGGLSFPKLGATPFGYTLAEQFGIRVVPPRPGLVPLCFPPAEQAVFSGLSGVSLDCETRAGPGAPRFREHLLFTHRGLSGPAILQISSHLDPGEGLAVDLLPGRPALEWLRDPSRRTQTLRQALRGIWPERFAQLWTERHAGARPLAQWPRRDLEALVEQIHGWRPAIAGDEGYAKAEVTLGGVDTAELSSKTMESRQVPGLHFIGEVVDVTGWLGGFNFQWAWASAHAAGMAV